MVISCEDITKQKTHLRNNSVVQASFSTEVIVSLGNFRPIDLNMLGVSTLYLCVLSVSFTINCGLVGKIPFEDFHFDQSVLYILDVREFKDSRWRGLAKKSLSKLTFVSLK